MKKGRKGIFISIRALMGLIVGAVLLVALIGIIWDVAHTPEDYEGPFLTLAENVKSINEGETFASSTLTLKLDENMALLGFSPVRQSGNEIKGDGNLHYIYYPPGSTISGNRGEVLGEHILRPKKCLPEQSCLCLCTGLVSVGENLKTKDQLTEQEHAFLNKNYPDGTPVKSKSIVAPMSCQQVTCENIGQSPFIENISSAYLNKDYKVLFDTEDKEEISKSEKIFINGFALVRGGSISSYAFAYSPEHNSLLLKNTPLTIHKLSTEELLICMKPDCDKEFDPVYSGGGGRQTVGYLIDENGLLEAAGSDFVVIGSAGTCTVGGDYLASSAQMESLRNNIEENLYEERSALIGADQGSGLGIEEGSVLRTIIKDNYVQLQLFAQCAGEGENGHRFLRGYQIPIKSLAENCKEQEVLLDHTSLALTFLTSTTEEVGACLEVS